MQSTPRLINLNEFKKDLSGNNYSILTKKNHYQT